MAVFKTISESSNGMFGIGKSDCRDTGMNVKKFLLMCHFFPEDREMNELADAIQWDTEFPCC